MKNLNTNLCENRYGVNEKTREKSLYIIEDFLTKIESFDMSVRSIKENLSVLGLIAEAYPLLVDKEKWNEICYSILKNIKNSLETSGYSSLALYDGLANLGFFCMILVKNSGYFKQFLDKINEILINTLMEQITFMEKSWEVFLKTSWFDTISGVSGIGYYLLCSNRIEADDKKVQCIKAINTFLMKLAVYREIGGYDIPGWYINGNNQETEDYRKDYPNGSINYSMSHGIAGPLIYLSESINQNIELEGQKKAIQFIVNELNRVCQSLFENGYLWPGIISYEKYVISDYKQMNNRLSWCYGGISNLIGILNASKVLKDEALSKWAFERLYEIAGWDMEKYYLFSPIICHGYAGTAVIFYELYNLFHNQIFKDKGNELMELLVNSYNESNPYGFNDITFKQLNDTIIKEEKDKLDFLNGSCGCVMALVAMLKCHIDFKSMLML